MTDSGFHVRFWGTRGSLPVAGPDYARFGGNTACVEMRCGGHVLFFDAGSGIRAAGMELLGSSVRKVDLFFTHSHYDHIVGMPFFKPIYDGRFDLAAWSGHLAGKMTTGEMLSEFMRPPWFPVELSICRASLVARDFKAGDVLKPHRGITIHTGSLNHPGGCVGYRVEYGGRIVCMISDTEHVEGELDPTVLALIRDADLVIYDCTYTDEEMPRFRGFGHSTWQQGVKLCEAAGARGLAIYHHDPLRTDAMLARIEAEARAAFPGAFAAYDGQVIDMPARAKTLLKQA